MSVKIDRTGETRVNNQGLKMTIVAYRSNMDIDVKFEDSTVVCNLAYHAFRKGQVKHPNFYSIQRGGMSTTNHQGLKMTIVNYVGCMDIDVQFEDGTIVAPLTPSSPRVRSTTKIVS